MLGKNVILGCDGKDGILGRDGEQQVVIMVIFVVMLSSMNCMMLCLCLLVQEEMVLMGVMEYWGLMEFQGYRDYWVSSMCMYFKNEICFFFFLVSLRFFNDIEICENYDSF